MKDRHPIRRATLLVGYGRFGREVLRRVLAASAPRGVLDWEEPAGGARASERDLRDLALLHIPDRLAVEPGARELDETADARGPAGIMGDLYRQIQVLEPRSDPRADLSEAAVRIAEKLLSATARANRGDAQPLGLDVIVTAHPGEPEVLGLLDDMLAAAMDALANNANLVRAVSGAGALNALEILDFENYWDASEAGRRLRRAASSSLAQWEKRRAGGRPAPGRVYLVDGRTADGIRDRRHRIDEISLFLELLLFEGQRGGDLQHLWRAAGAHESPLAVFGVRSMERSAGLLARIAAARFAVDWLDYLAGESSPGGETPGLELAERLAVYRSERLDRRLGADELRAYVAGELRGLEAELLALPSEDPGWPAAVIERYTETARRTTAHVAGETAVRVDALRRERLDQLPAELAEGIAADLHHDRRPVPLGRVVRTLEEAAAELEAAADRTEPETAEDDGGAAASAGPAEAARAELDALTDAYRRFRRGQVRLDGLRQQWWPLWAAVLAAGLTPSLRALIAEIPPPDPTKVLLVKAYGALQWTANPIALAVILFLAVWALGATWFQKLAAARQSRAARFYHDADRGRFADRLRAELSETGTLGAPLYRELELTLEDTALSVRGAVSREIARALERLRERRREMLWLAGELRDFLKLHGVTLAEGWHELDRRRRDGTGIRQSAERGEDLERILERNPPSPERFRSTQADERPFEGWDERYGDTFLFPLPFLDRLSRIYDEGVELTDPGPDFLAFLDRHGSFDLAFAWKAQDGLPADRRYSLLPAAWHRRPGLVERLADLRTSEDDVLVGADAARAYLLRLRTGIAPRCLLEAGAAEEALADARMREAAS